MNSFSHSKVISEYGNSLYKSDNIGTYNKKICNELNIIKLKKKQEIKDRLNLFHTNVLFRKFNFYTRQKINIESSREKNGSNLSLFLTKVDNSEINQIRTTTTIESSRPKDFLGRNITNSINSISLIDYGVDNYKKPCSFNDPIDMCLDQGKYLNTISNFIDKTRVIRRFRINKGIQEQKLLRLKEDEFLEYEYLKKIIYERELAKKYLEDYLNTMHKYKVHLNGIINEGKKILEDILTYKNELQLDIIQIHSQINKKMKILEQCKQYKIFLLLVKFEVKDITLIPKKQLSKYGITISEKQPLKKTEEKSKPILLKNSNHHIKKNNNRFSVGFLKKPKVRRSSVFETDNLIFEQDISPLANPIIFESPEDLKFQFQVFDNKLRKLIEKYDQLKIENNKLIVERKEELEKFNELIDDSNSETLRIMKKDILILKEKFNDLEKKKFNILKTQSNHKTISQNIIFTKLKNILIKFPINIETNFNYVGFYKNINTKAKEISIKGKTYNKSIYCLKVLELICIHYFNFRASYLLDPNHIPIYKHIVYELEQKKKLEKNIENKYKEIRRREIIAEKVLEKNKKIIIVSRRKIDKFDSLMKIEKQIEKKKLERLRKYHKTDESKYEPWISY